MMSPIRLYLQRHRCAPQGVAGFLCRHGRSIDVDETLITERIPAYVNHAQDRPVRLGRTPLDLPRADAFLYDACSQWHRLRWAGDRVRRHGAACRTVVATTGDDVSIEGL